MSKRLSDFYNAHEDSNRAIRRVNSYCRPEIDIKKDESLVVKMWMWLEDNAILAFFLMALIGLGMVMQ